MEALSRMISNYLREIFPEGDDWLDILLKVTGVVVGVVALIIVLWFQNEAFGPNVN